MDIDLNQLADEELLAVVVAARKEVQRRVADDKQPSREPLTAARLAMESRGVGRGWSGYAAVSKDDNGVTHIMQPDRDNRVVDIWLQCPASYTEEAVRELQTALISVVAGHVRP